MIISLPIVLMALLAGLIVYDIGYRLGELSATRGNDA